LNHHVGKNNNQEDPVQGKDLLSIADLSSEEINILLADAIAMKHDKRLSLLEGKTLGLLFEKPSLRTRTSFELAMQHLGGCTIFLSPDEVGLGKRETIKDTALVLSRFFNAVAVRTHSHKTVVELALNATVPVINALDDSEHPCQALGDLLTIYEKKEDLKNLSLAYIGEGNNVANSLMLACTMMGMNFRIASPPGYQVMEPLIDIARELVVGSHGELFCTHSPQEAAAEADIVYTDSWILSGQEEETKKRRQVFSGYKVTRSIMDLAKSDALFMHPMPACHGEEVDDEVFYGPHSVVFDQVENALYVEKALLAEMLGGLDIFLSRHK
jgi:ornithine carbamoyltransferase